MGDSNYITYTDEKGNVNISEEVVAIIAANAAMETDGVASLSASFGKDIAELLGKKNISKGVKITLEEDKIKADIYIMVKIGAAIGKVGKDVQKAVAQAIESMTGITVSEVNVNISGLSLIKDK